MKRRGLLLLTALIAVCIIAGAAWAGNGWGNKSGGIGRGNNPCYMDRMGYTGEGGPEYQKFRDDTAELRQELAGKRGEYHALMNAQNPDPKQAGKLQQEMTRIRDQIHSKAQASGIRSAANCPYGSGKGFRGQQGRLCR